MGRIYHTKRFNRAYIPVSNEENNWDCVIGITSNMMLIVVDKNNDIIGECPAPEEMRKYSNIVKDFKEGDPLWEYHMLLYFGEPQIYGDDCL